MGKWLYVALVAAGFGVGAYVWRISNTGSVPAYDEPSQSPPEAAAPVAESTVVVEVGQEQITRDDVDWEYKGITDGVLEADDLTQIPDLASRYHSEMVELRRSILSGLIERKLLYQIVRQDREFNPEDPARFAACMSEWQSLKEANPAVARDPQSRERLKARLCERSLIQQYVDERISARITVSEAEILAYYNDHRSEFRVPERAEILHILSGTESEAKKVRNMLKPGNFQDLARAHSIAPEAASGGRLGPFAKGTMPVVFDTAFVMKNGQISDIHKSHYGYHIIMLVDKLPAKELGPDEVRNRIEEMLKSRKRDEEYRRWIDQSLATVRVTTPRPLW